MARLSKPPQEQPRSKIFFERGCSWGGFESLAIAYTYNWSEEEQAFHNLNRSIVRLHCGLEGAENLIADLSQALDKI